MFCDSHQVNQLTSLLLQHGLRHIVVCPGSRNATIVHNLNELPSHFTLHPVTDERSAAFVALGMVLALQEPVAICVTSGSALLNCIPAVAEAFYRHLPLLVISADRPQRVLGQLDGQTLPQIGALRPYCPTFQVDPTIDEACRHVNNRRINEAFLSLHNQGGHPAHINVSIEEPMFSFTTPHLPQERVISVVRPIQRHPIPEEVVQLIASARLPVLLLGQYERGDLRKQTDDLNRQNQLLILPEIISDVQGNFRMNAFDELVSSEPSLIPDVVIQVGGNFVHKSFKSALRKSHNCRVIRIAEEDALADTFDHLTLQIQAPANEALKQLSEQLPHTHQGVVEAALKLDHAWAENVQHRSSEVKALTLDSTLQSLQEALSHYKEAFTLHLANSSTIRAAGRHFKSGSFPIFCNRGTNGIEGSLSTAVGYALQMWGLSIVVIGDLSFFYDVNALWNTHLPHNLRILLLNNGHGGIFDHLPGLDQSPARTEYVAAGYQHFTAEGVAKSFHVGYLRADSLSALPTLMQQWIAESEEAQILEIFLNN